jgi:outer membrane protein assembly factor BamB
MGQGYSGFILVEGKAYTQDQSLTGQSVLCLNAETGAELWTHRYDWPWQPASLYPGPYATPTYYQGRIYFSAPSGLVGCLEAETGREIWSLNVIKQFGGRGTEFGYACTPCVEDGKVFLTVGGKGASVVALDAADGAVVWSSGNDEASYCPAFPITFHGQRIIIGFLRNALVAFDLATGRQIWRQKLSSDYDEHSAWPLYIEPKLWISFPFKAGSQVLQIDQERDTISARVVKIIPELSSDIFSSVLVNGHVYGFDLQEFQAKAHRPSRGQFKCLEWSTGKVRWNTDQVGHANVLAADGKLLLFNDTGCLILARANPERYEELARVQVLTGGLCWTAPALSRRRLIVRNAARAACLYLGNPDELRPEQRQQAISAAEIPTSKAATWMSRIVPREREYPFDAPTRRELLLWFESCMVGVFGSAAALALGVHTFVRLRTGHRGQVTQAVFWSSAFLFGLIGTSVFSEYGDTFVLTWPASLFVAYQVTTIAITDVERQTERRKWRWLSRAVALLFLGLCLAYYEVCKMAGIVMGWSFLVGLLPASPLTILTAWSQAKRQSLLLQLVYTLLAFAVYFWASGLFVGWKMGLIR